MSRSYLTVARQLDLLSQLTPADLALLHHVCTLRFLTGSQLTRLCFTDATDPAANARAARRALLRLVTLGALERLPRQVGGVRAGSAAFIYYLGPVGQRLAVLESWQPERRRRRSLSPGLLFLRHSLQVAELHVRLIESDRSRRFELLELTSEPSCWRDYDGPHGQRLRLKPDSYLRLGLGEYEDSYFIEVDRGTEGSQTIVRQLRSYGTYYQSGHEQQTRGVFPRVLWLTPSTERAEAIQACIEPLPSETAAVFQVARFDDALQILDQAPPGATTHGA
jgi:hypothetical protein